MFELVRKTTPAIFYEDFMRAYLRNPINSIPFLEYNQTVQNFASLKIGDPGI